MRMSFESFTRHCSGTVTSITFAFSLFLLLSLTNFPYQALTMMRPEDGLGQSGAPAPSLPSTRSWTAGAGAPLNPLPTLSRERPRLLTHSGFFCLDYSSDRFLHQPNLQRRGQAAIRPSPGSTLCSDAAPLPAGTRQHCHLSWMSAMSRKTSHVRGRERGTTHHVKTPCYAFRGSPSLILGTEPEVPE